MFVYFLTYPQIMHKIPCRLIDIRPNHDLLNANFEGYKLSLEDVPTIKKTLTTNVLKLLPKSSQFSLLHIQYLSLHNHLFGETNLDGDCLYYIDTSWQVNKIILNPVYYYNNDSSVVFIIPPSSKNDEDNFNVSLHLLSHMGLAVLSDGFGKFYILDTNENSWKIIYSAELFDIGSQFHVKDAKCTINTDNSQRTIDCVFFSIKNEQDKQCSVLHVITFAENNQKIWNQTVFKELCCKGSIYYNYLDRDTNHTLIVVSDQPAEFVKDSEYPIQDITSETSKKIYTWSQNELQITLNIPISSLRNCYETEQTLASSTINEEDIKIVFTHDFLSVKFKNYSLLEGKLYARILEEESNFQITDDALRICLSKWEGRMMWPEIVIGDKNGEYDISKEDTERIHQKLEHLCSEEEVSNDNLQIYNSEQTEDCDYPDPITAPILERLDTGASHAATHRVYLNAHGILLTIPSENVATEIPAICLRLDVDALIYKFGTKSEQEWDMWHDGSLFAFGYVQASKQQRKFTVCPPDLSYVAILESSRHIFVYRQGRAVSGGCELRHRTSGRRFASVAQQQVISMGANEILGVYVTNTTMYVLTEAELVILNIV